MDFFATDEELARLEYQVDQDQHDISGLLALAWQLRQRDCQRALALAQQAQACLDTQARPHPLLQMRLNLVRAETLWLSAQLETATTLANQVLQHSTNLLNSQPQSQEICELQTDAHWLIGWLHNERGQAEQRDAHWQQMAESARQAQDPLRAEFAEACLAAMMSFRSPKEAEPLAEQYIKRDLSKLHPALLAVIYDFLGLQVRMGADLGRSAAYWMHSYEAACKTGQIRRAIISAGNIGSIFANLNDHSTALDWMERSLNLARPTGWPGAIGNCLMHTASCLRQVGRIEAAQTMLEEALETMDQLRASRNYAIALWFLGDLAIDRKDYDLALNAFCRLQERADALLQSDFQTNSRRGQAQALALLERYDEALAMADAALQLAHEQNDINGQIETLKVLARIHTQHKLPPPAGMQESNAQLHYLSLALKLASDIEGYTIPGELLDEIADAHAGAGNFGKAFAFGRRANSAREKTHNMAATNRAVALQVQHQTERARAEGEHLRKLAQAEAQRAAAESKRAQVLQDTSSTLTHLGAIGQEITAQLDIEAVFNALKRHVRSLLDASYFVIYLTDADEQGLYSIFRQQGEQLLQVDRIDKQHPHSYAARCMREREELMISMAPEQENPALVGDARPTLSALFGPLMVANRLLGVMSIQSEQVNAYGERERLIFRNLCAYGAIALANANAYTRLQETQQQLVAQEKLAALGALVAGVAHELNTPLGNSLVVASGLQDQVLALEKQLCEKALSLQDLQEFIWETKEATGMILRGLQGAANLVMSFKQVAVDRTSAQMRRFDLLQTTQEIVATMTNQIRSGGHSLQLDIAPGILMQSYPGPYGQVMTHLINNAVAHAFFERNNGQMHLSARQNKPGRVEIIFRDNGVGIAPEHLKQIFDPFFTTRFGQGGNGLGLSICYNIVTSLLQGNISVESEPGNWTLFKLELPLVVA